MPTLTEPHACPIPYCKGGASHIVIESRDSLEYHICMEQDGANVGIPIFFDGGGVRNVCPLCGQSQ